MIATKIHSLLVVLITAFFFISLPAWAAGDGGADAAAADAAAQAEASASDSKKLAFSKAAVAGKAEQTSQDITTVMGTIHQAGGKLAGALLPMGKGLLAILTGIGLAWAILTGMMAVSLEKSISQMLNILVYAGFATAMLLGWGGAGDANSIGVSSFFFQGMDAISSAISEASGSGSSSDVTDLVVTNSFNAITSMFSLVGAVMDIKTGGGIFNLGPVFLGVVSGALVVIVVLVGAGILAITMALTLVYYNMGTFMIYIGLAVGPLFVAMMVMKSTFGYFEGWLQFMLGAAMYKIVGLIMTILTAAIFDSLAEQAADLAIDAATTDGGVLAFSIVILAAFWAVMAFMMAKQIPSIATSLVGGANLRADMPASRQIQGAASKAAKPAAGLAAKGAGAIGGAAKTAAGNLGGNALKAGAKAAGARAMATAKAMPRAAGSMVGGFKAGMRGKK